MAGARDMHVEEAPPVRFFLRECRPDVRRVLLALCLLMRALPGWAAWDVSNTAQAGQWTIWGRSAYGASSGLSVASGDFNGDGRSDVLLAAMNANGGPSGNRSQAGEVLIVLSSGVVGGGLDLAALEPAALPETVTMTYGADPLDFLGTHVAAADLDGDGYDDALIGAQYGDGAGNVRPSSGEVVILWGGPAVGGRLVDMAALQPGDSVTRIYGAESGDRLGVWVDSGDFDGDGYDDALLGADQAGGPDNARAHAGETYVIYGGAHLRERAEIDVAAPSVPLTVVYGVDPEDHSGSTIRSGDLNGDVARELLIGAGLNRLSAAVTDSGFPGGHAVVGGDGPLEDRANAGEVYAIYGLAGFRPPSIDLRDPPASMVTVYGARAGDSLGEDFFVGDFNDDGYGDLIVGAPGADGPGSSRANGGEATLILGGPSLPGSRIDLAVPSANTTRLYGAATDDNLGDTVLFADLDGDHLDDLVLGSPQISRPAPPKPGNLKIIFGTTTGPPAAIDLSDPPPGFVPFAIEGGQTSDMLAYEAAAGNVDGDGFSDLIFDAIGGDGADEIHPDAGDTYVVSGFLLSDAAGRAVRTPTPSVAQTETGLPTASETAMETPTQTRTGSPTASSLATATPTRSVIALPSATSTRVATATPTDTVSPTGAPDPTRTATAAATGTFTRLPGCAGDCDGNAAVTVEELILGVNIALGSRAAAECPGMDGNQDTIVSVDELVRAVTAALDGCAAASPTRTRSNTPTRSVTAPPSVTPTEAPGPRIVSFAVLRADNSAQEPVGSNDQGVPIYERAFSFGFFLVVEAVRGPSGRAVGTASFNDFDCADLEVQVTRALGNGDPRVCEPQLALSGGVPATEPPVFGDDSAICARYNDLSCRFLDGGGNTAARRCSDGCVKFETAEFGCLMPEAEQQFCALVDTSIAFPVGDTLVTARVRDVDGNPGDPARIIVRVAGP